MKDLHLEHIRREYSSRTLDRRSMPEDPMSIVNQWIEEAIQLKVHEPTAMLVATATSNGSPSLRTVLLKEVLDGKFVFYTNYNSRKGLQIAHNPRVAASFVWHELERQIHIEGAIEQVSSEVSDAYFDIRPYKSRVGARISPQSQPIPSRAFIMKAFVLESARYIGQHIPRPNYWGGYEIIPERIELWQGRDSRLHDRFVYTKYGDGWHLERVAP